MARRPNYGFDKRQKELDKQKKKDAKAEKKQAKREERAQTANDAGAAEEHPAELAPRVDQEPPRD